MPLCEWPEMKFTSVQVQYEADVCTKYCKKSKVYFL